MEVVQDPGNIREEKLAALMEKYEKDLLKISCVYLRDAGLAQDAVQETFLKAYKALSSFRGESSEKTWLMRIAMNTCKDMRAGAWYRFVDRRVSMDRLPEPAAAPSERSTRVTEDVMRLPRKEMEIILLYYYQDMTQEEIARALGVTVPSVSRRLKKAREKLRAVLEGGPDEDDA